MTEEDKLTLKALAIIIASVLAVKIFVTSPPKVRRRTRTWTY